MSVTTIVLRWLADRLPIDTYRPSRNTGNGRDARGTRRSAAPAPLQWRRPWQAWQVVSWLAVTLLAPPFWVIGVLLMINAHSDRPFFWPSAMAVIAIANLVAIVHANQCHYRQPFIRRNQLARRYFGTAMLTGGALFVLLLWSTGILQDFAEPLATTMGTTDPASATVLWTAIATVGFGVLSFAHAGMLHAWLSFEVPAWHWNSRGATDFNATPRRG